MSLDRRCIGFRSGWLRFATAVCTVFVVQSATVADDLRLSGGDGAKPAEKTAAPADKTPTAPSLEGWWKQGQMLKVIGGVAETVEIDIPADADPQAAWEAHFAANTESAAAVRLTVRKLMKEGRPGQVVAVITAALRNNQAQPWMYEALGLAMAMQGAGESDIERALMSSVDFSAKPDDLMAIAEYMEKSQLAGKLLRKRALDLYRQVAALQPMRPEAYVFGLRLARHLDDIDGLKWSTIGVLSQAWPLEQKSIVEEADRIAKALVERLREQDAARADEYQAALNEARIRDCEINVYWSGDADVDLYVDEPGGTLCSFRIPRTTSGGVLVGDAYDAEKSLHCETYVCPQGFNGDYRITAKRVWGKVNADNVVVEIVSHKGTADEKREQRTIPLTDDAVTLAFDLEDGRRTESVEQVQLANVVEEHISVQQHVLAQQLAQLSDPLIARSPIALDPRNNPNLFLRGAVGYQPIIVSLPAGANMSATAVVSHDRRYVRVSAQPLFSTIPSVNTFNYATGSSGTSGGATNGPGGGTPGIPGTTPGTPGTPGTPANDDLPPYTTGLLVAVAPWFGWYADTARSQIAGDGVAVRLANNGANSNNYLIEVPALNGPPTRLNNVGPGAGAGRNVGDVLAFNGASVLQTLSPLSSTRWTGSFPAGRGPGVHFFMLGVTQPIAPISVVADVVDTTTNPVFAGFEFSYNNDPPSPVRGGTLTYAGLFYTLPNAPNEAAFHFGGNGSYVPAPETRIVEIGFERFSSVGGPNNLRYGLSDPLALPYVFRGFTSSSQFAVGPQLQFYYLRNSTQFYRPGNPKLTLGQRAVARDDPTGSGVLSLRPSQFQATIILVYDHFVSSANARTIIEWMDQRGANDTILPPLP